MAPSAKAYFSPLRITPDRVKIRLRLYRNRISLDGEATVRSGVHDAMNYAVVCAVAFGVTAGTVGLCVVRRVNGLATFAIAAACFGLIFTIGLIRTPRKPSEHN